jgi:hypothetical protein
MGDENVLDVVRTAQETLERIQQSLEAIGSTPRPVAPPVAPSATAGIMDQAISVPHTSPFLTQSETFAMRRELRQLSDNELYSVFAQQARKKNVGVPFEAWMAMGGNPLSAGFEQLQARELSPEVQKLLDTSGGSALIRQDLEPILYELYIRTFPAFDRFPKEPANGLVHTFQQITSFGDAQFMGELGTVTDDRSEYVRQTTNVAILATRRGISLKSQFATLQSGSGFNPEQLEMQGGLRAISARMQRTIFSGNSSDSGGDADNELGAYDPNGFTGLRSILNTARAKDANISAPLPENQDDARRAINSAAVEIMDAVTGSGPVLAYLSAPVKEKIDEQQDKNVRYQGNLVNVGVGVNTNVINTVFGPLPLFPIPGNSIGTYDKAGKDVSDCYLVDEASMSLPYLGSPGPTVLDIPIGISGQLTHLFIIFVMMGLAVKAPIMSNKVRFRLEA